MPVARDHFLLHEHPEVGMAMSRGVPYLEATEGWEIAPGAVARLKEIVLEATRRRLDGEPFSRHEVAGLLRELADFLDPPKEAT